MDTRSVAIISDVVMEYGGAEKVLESFLEMYPNSTLFSLLIAPQARERLVRNYPNVKIVHSPFSRFFGKVVRSKYISLIKIVSWIYWEFLDLSDYELVISSSHSFMSKNVKTIGKTFHLSYIHTPPRYLYDEFNEIEAINRFPIRELFWPVRIWLRWIDQRGSLRPDVLVVNSLNVQNRVRKYYGRESILVYPPVEVGDVKRQRTSDYFAVVSRLVKQKGVAVAVSACTESRKKLVVIGGGDEQNNLEKIAGATVSFVGRCSDAQKIKILSKAKALLYTSIDEDFGIVPIEALKLGIPVIAHNSGGVKESVIDGQNGLLFSELSTEGMLRAIERFELMEFNKSRCIDSAKRFSKKTFINEIKKIIKNGGR